MRRGQVDVVCRCIAVATYTGEVGDGKVFVQPVADILRMCGALAEMAPRDFACARECHAMHGSCASVTRPESERLVRMMPPA
jgi:Nitrogen regulatory protein P-II